MFKPDFMPKGTSYEYSSPSELDTYMKILTMSLGIVALSQSIQHVIDSDKFPEEVNIYLDLVCTELGNLVY